MSSLLDRVESLGRRLAYAPDEEAVQLEAAVLNAAFTATRRRPTALPDVIRTHPPERVAAARERTLADYLAVRSAAVSDSLSTAEAARRLAISPAAVTKRRAAGRLAAFRHKGDWRYPAWQFADDAVLAGVAAALRAMPSLHDDLARVRWFVLPSRALDGRTPLELLRAGDVDAVVAAAGDVASR